ncbi:protein SREK1IP1 isoform X1 [Manacus candei]|uniref:protein SREK1IP1 isoform X1 n=1 Tax=Manacus candei TaxID=415023 RepID=UPI0022260583|nr:protein SREK1IP1 isoform X1 [Manacus candei]
MSGGVMDSCVGGWWGLLWEGGREGVRRWRGGQGQGQCSLAGASSGPPHAVLADPALRSRRLLQSQIRRMLVAEIRITSEQDAKSVVTDHGYQYRFSALFLHAASIRNFLEERETCSQIKQSLFVFLKALSSRYRCFDVKNMSLFQLLLEFMRLPNHFFNLFYFTLLFH